MQTKMMEMKAIIEGRVVTGLASVFGNVDSYGDVMHPGAFRKTIREGTKRVKHLWMHDYSTPPTAVIHELREVGPEELPGEVLERFPEAKGGLVVVREYLETPRAEEIFQGIRAGAINEMSFAYDALKWDEEEREEKVSWSAGREGSAGQEDEGTRGQGDGEGGRESKKRVKVRNLREVRLWDTSDVTWGANEATVASKADGLERSHIELAITSLQDALSIKVERSAGKAGEIMKALKILNEMLRSAEPGVEIDAALTEAVLRRLRSADIDLRLRGVTQ